MVKQQQLPCKKKDPNVWVIGVDKDQAKTFGHDITLTSMMKYVDVAVKQVSTDLANGKFEGKVLNLGLKDNGVGLPAENPNVPADVLAKVKEYQDKIIKGEIVVPEAPEKKK
jgi:basic membrane protein A and related proteins